jgi:hypothetical protein
LKCDGYGGQLLHVSSSPTETAAVVLGGPLLPRRNPWPTLLNQQDVIYFDLFRVQLVYDLSGYSCSDFWTRIVLCESMTDACIMESVLAIAALSTAVKLASQLSDPPTVSKWPSALHPWAAEAVVNDHHRAAVRHYIKGLSLFRGRIQAATASPRSVLIMSMLFITFEMLQGNMKTVDGLITCSINLLKDTLKIYRQDLRSSRKIKPAPRIEDDMEDIEHLLPLVSIMGGYTPFLSSQSANIQLWDTSSCHDLPDLRRPSIAKLQIQWSKFYTRTAAFIGHVLAIQMQATMPLSTVEDQHRVLILQLKVWEAELDSWLADSGVVNEPAQRTLQIIQIQHLTLFICASCCLDITDLSFDAHDADFYKLLTLCAIFLHEARPSYLFTLSTSILVALATVIIKCRVHNIRMMAAALIRQLPWREGAWDAGLMMYGKLGGVLLEERMRDGDGFIAPQHRWFCMSEGWDIESGVVVARYARAVPDEGGVPVHKKLVLDLSRYPDVCSSIGCVEDHAAQCRVLHLSLIVE